MNGTRESLSFATKLWVSLPLILLNILTVLANLLVIAIVFANHRLRKCTNYLVVNLSIADLLFACTSYPFVIGSVIRDEESVNYALCQFVGFSDSFYTTTASFSVAIIAYERYYSIIHCLHYEQCMMNRNTRPVLTVLWVTSLIICSAPLLKWGTYGYERHQYKCTLNFIDDTGYFFFKITSTLLLPITVMTVCYSWIFVVAKRHASSITTIEIRVQNDLVQGGSQPKGVSSKKHHTGSVFIAILVHVVCFLPINLMYLVKNIRPSLTIPGVAISVGCLFSLLPSGINPVVYALVTGKFRKGFVRLCKKFRLQKATVSSCKRTVPGTWTLSSARFSRHGSTSNAKFFYRSENNEDRVGAEADTLAVARQSGPWLDVKHLEKGQRVLSPIEVDVDENYLSVSTRRVSPRERPALVEIDHISSASDCYNI